MAIPSKVREYLATTETEANYRLMAQGFFQQLSLEMACKGDQEGVDFAEVQIRFQNRVTTSIIDLIARLMGELFTDDELDQLITIYNMPVSRKQREQIPVFQQEVLNLVSGGDFERIFKEVLAEYK